MQAVKNKILKCIYYLITNKTLSLASFLKSTSIYTLKAMASPTAPRKPA